MIKLALILEELIEENDLDSTLRFEFAGMANEIGQDIENAVENSPQNEAVLAATALALAVPGILSTISKVIEAILKKSGINLNKSNKEPWYKLLGNTAEKIDSYLDVPFKKMLSVFMKDEEKKTKIAKFLKALTLSSMAIAGSVDIKNISDISNSIRDLGQEAGGELIQAIGETNAKKLAVIAKNFFNNLK